MFFPLVQAKRRTSGCTSMQPTRGRHSYVRSTVTSWKVWSMPTRLHSTPPSGWWCILTALPCGEYADSYCTGYPGYFRQPHWMSMGLPKISRVTWYFWLNYVKLFCPSVSDNKEHSILWLCVTDITHETKYSNVYNWIVRFSLKVGGNAYQRLNRDAIAMLSLF